MGQRVAVEFPRMRLDPCPLDRETMCVVVHRTELFEVVSISAVVIDGDDRITATGDRLGMIRNPPRPVVVDATLHLMRGGGAPQEELLGQLPRRHPPAAGAARTRRRNPSAGSSTITLTPFLRLHARTAKACSAIGDRTSRRPPGSRCAYARRTRSSAPGSVHSSSEPPRSSTVLSGMPTSRWFEGRSHQGHLIRIRLVEGGRLLSEAPASRESSGAPLPGSANRASCVCPRRFARVAGRYAAWQSLPVAFLKRPIMRGCPHQSRSATMMHSTKWRRAHGAWPAQSGS